MPNDRETLDWTLRSAVFCEEFALRLHHLARALRLVGAIHSKSPPSKGTGLPMTTPKLPSKKNHRQQPQTHGAKSTPEHGAAAQKAKERQRGRDVDDREKATG